jgi:hypothetical protein
MSSRGEIPNIHGLFALIARIEKRFIVQYLTDVCLAGLDAAALLPIFREAALRLH